MAKLIIVALPQGINPVNVLNLEFIDGEGISLVVIPTKETYFPAVETPVLPAFGSLPRRHIQTERSGVKYTMGSLNLACTTDDYVGISLNTVHRPEGSKASARNLPRLKTLIRLYQLWAWVAVETTPGQWTCAIMTKEELLTRVYNLKGKILPVHRIRLVTTTAEHRVEFNDFLQVVDFLGGWDGNQWIGRRRLDSDGLPEPAVRPADPPPWEDDEGGEEDEVPPPIFRAFEYTDSHEAIPRLERIEVETDPYPNGRGKSIT